MELGLVPTRQRARALVMAGKVLVDDRVVDKPGTRIPADARPRLRAPDHPYVGRGGLKLSGALEDLDLRVDGLRCLDVGSSTGGFTDCLLQRGAASVVAVDVGTNQLAYRLRVDERVDVRERTDVRDLAPGVIGDPVDLAVIDVSFISLRLVLPPVAALVAPEGHILAMIKPQFEVGRDRVGRGGVVRDPRVRQEAIDGVVAFAREMGLRVEARADSRVAGAKKGNVEHFVLWRG